MDAARLKASWARVAGHGDAVPAHFYAVLFSADPGLRMMFPASMASQRDRLVSALGRIVSNVDQLDAVVPFVQGLGRDHRKFDVRPEHYGPVGEALLATLACFLGEAWTRELAADWTDAYGVIARVMVEAAEQAARSSPPWWAATVVGHERRGLDVAVLHVQPERPYPYRPGQSCAVEIPARPRLWRYYSPANYPRRDGLIELHVKAVPGGQVSTGIVHGLQAGDGLRLAAPIGHRLILDPDSARDLLLLAGGTGLAPLKALVEQLAFEGGQRRMALFVGARTSVDLYDLPALDAMCCDLPWLTVVPALSHDPWHPAERGAVVDVALRLGRWDDRDIYVCGSAAMVAASRDRLVQVGVSIERIRCEDYTDDPYRPVETLVAEPVAYPNEVPVQ